MIYTDDQIAKAVHTVNGLLQEFHGEAHRQPDWEHAPDSMRCRVHSLIRLYRAGGTPREAHTRWVESMAADGWRHGLSYDEGEHLHPNMVPYGELPQLQRAKDQVSHGLVVLLIAAGER
jgi:hypothetical protein